MAKHTGTPVRNLAAAAPSEVLRSADVILAVGQALVERAGGSGAASEDLAKGMKVFVGDRIVTKDDGRVRLRFPELSEVFVSPRSTLVIAEALVEKRTGASSKRAILLDLVKGRVRSRVQGRYGDGESKFEIKTRSAVAGVRGTDFTVSFDANEADWKTEVRTVTGDVELSAAGVHGEKHHASVLAGTYAAHKMPAPAPDATSFEVNAAMAQGFITPILQLSPEDLRDLDSILDMRVGSVDASRAARRPAATAQESSLCRAPAGSFNQCSWTCEGSSKTAHGKARREISSKSGGPACRTDLPGVRCVRRLCRANGEWSEATVLPETQGVNCEASKPIVGDCGGYW